MVVEQLGLHLWAEPEDVVHDGPDAPQRAIRSAVRMPSDAPNFSPGFYFVLSDRGLDPDRPRLLDRYYLHVRRGIGVRCVELVTTRLNAADLPFRLKVVDDPRNFGRCDTAVLTCQRKDRRAALEHVHELRDLLHPGPGALGAGAHAAARPRPRLLRGPEGMSSFGAHRCRLIAAALVEAHEAGRTEPGDRMELVRAHMARAGTTPEAPYLGPHSAGDPRAAGAAPLERKEPTPCR